MAFLDGVHILTVTPPKVCNEGQTQECAEWQHWRGINSFFPQLNEKRGREHLSEWRIMTFFPQALSHDLDNGFMFREVMQENTADCSYKCTQDMVKVHLFTLGTVKDALRHL